VRPRRGFTGRRDLLVVEECSHAPCDLVADGSDGGQVEAGRVVEVPVLAGLPDRRGTRRRRPW
jgi:hypothetical protein